jgi:ABC-type branched-subunit amino acid transport system substrate-binding protein
MKNRVAKQIQRGVTILAVALATLLLFTACAPAATTPPVEGKKVVEIGDIAILTGGGGSAEQPAFLGRQDYVRYFNEEKGIPGVTIELMWRDCGTQIPKFISSYRMLVGSGVPVIYSSYPTPLEGLKPQLEKDQTPFVAGGVTGSLVYPPGWVYCVWATPGESATAVFDYFMESWTEERSPKLQLFVLDETYGRSPAAEVTPYAESIGYEVLPLEVAPHVVIDATPQLLRIREREADLVYIQHIITGAGPIMRDVERLGLHDEMQFAGNEFILGEPLIKMSPVAAEGFLAPRPSPWKDETEIPGIKTMVDTQLKYHGKVHEDPVYISGWVYGAILCEAVKRAGEEVGYDNIDGPAVKGALENMKDFDIDGLAKITFGPERRRGTRDYAVYEVQGGKIVRVTDWREVPILVP